VTTTNAEQLLRAARARVSEVRPYFSDAAFAMILVESDGVPTMGVDKYKRLYFNPEWVLQHGVEELTTVVLHEIEHPLREHHLRAEAIGVTAATMQDANIAMDCSINHGLRHDAVVRKDIAHLPEPKDPRILALPVEMRGPFFPWKIDCEDGLLWEQYYEHLRNRDRRPSDSPLEGPNCGSGAHGVSMPWEADAPDKSDVEGVSSADWRDIQETTAQKIAKRQESHGDVCGSWAEWANELLSPPRVPWDVLLAGQLQWAINDASGLVYHTYQRPSRRQSAFPDTVMPNMRRPIPFVCAIGDTSASMDTTRLAYARGVVRDICQALGARVAFLATDTKVHGGTQVVSDGREVEFRGRGGTDMAAGIAYAVNEIHPKADALVVISDCETGWPAVAPPVKTVVCAIGATDYWIGKVPSWATLIKVEMENE